ncbi:MAG: protoporphyrinogen oxidase, partial [Candidatus Kapaibacterium sp.]
VGGVMGSHRNELGALVESGPNSAQFTTPLLSELIDDLDLGDRLVHPAAEAANRYILRDGRLMPVPTGLKSFFRSRLFSGAAKRRLMREPFIRAAVGEAEESIAQFVERRLGREVLDYAVNPFISGIYAGRPERLSLRHAMPMLHDLEREAGSLLRGGLKRMRAGKKARARGEAPARRGMFSFIDGMGELPGRIQERWGECIRTGVDVERIDRIGGSWHVVARGERFVAPNLVIATDAGTAAGLIAEQEAAAATALRSIEYPALAVASVLYDRAMVAHPLDGFGLLVPEVERRCILGAIFSSTLFPNRAPEGTVLLTAFIGGAREPGLALRSAEEIAYDVHAELRRTLGICARPKSFDLRVWNRAIPQYNLGHGAIIEAIELAEERLPGMHLLGNYRGGVSVGDCVKSGRALADRLLRRSGFRAAVVTHDQAPDDLYEEG